MQIHQQRAYQPTEQRRARGCCKRPWLRCETLLYPTPKLRCLQEPKDSYRTRAGVLHHPRSHFPEAMALLLSLLFLSCSCMAGASGQETLLKAPLVQQPWLGRWILSDRFKQH